MITKAQIKYIHSLQHKKYRQKFRRFLAEGDKICRELLEDRSQPVVHLYATENWLQQNEAACQSLDGQKVTKATRAELQNLSGLISAHEVLCECQMPEEKLLPDLTNKIALAVENIQDPGNFGTIIRIADWFNIPYIICSPDCVDQYNPKVVQATMGSIMRVQMATTDLPAFFRRESLPHIYAATLHGKSLQDFKKIRSGIICIGNESKGMSEELVKLSTQQLTIPRLGQAESLNAAVATGIICSHLLLG